MAIAVVAAGEQRRTPTALFEKIKQTKTYTNRQRTPTAMFEKLNKTKSNKQINKEHLQLCLKNKTNE